jgi:hypothetical protein
MKRRDLLKSAVAAGAGVMAGGSTEYRAAAAAAQVTGAGNDFETFELGDFTLLSGEVLRSATLA